MKKNKGYLLIEILISIFIFSILIFVVSIFLKRAILIEKIKKESQIVDEKVYFVMKKIEENIKNRNREIENYYGVKTNIYVKKNVIIYKKDKIYCKLEIEDNTIFVYDGENINYWGAKTELAKYDEILMEKIDNLLVFTIKMNKIEIVKIINLN